MAAKQKEEWFVLCGKLLEVFTKKVLVSRTIKKEEKKKKKAQQLEKCGILSRHKLSKTLKSWEAKAAGESARILTRRECKAWG